MIACTLDKWLQFLNAHHTIKDVKMCDRHTEKKIDGLEFWVQNLQFERLSFGESFNAKP